MKKLLFKFIGFERISYPRMIAMIVVSSTFISFAFAMLVAMREAFAANVHGGVFFIDIPHLAALTAIGTFAIAVPIGVMAVLILRNRQIWVRHSQLICMACAFFACYLTTVGFERFFGAAWHLPKSNSISTWLLVAAIVTSVVAIVKIYSSLRQSRLN